VGSSGLAARTAVSTALFLVDGLGLSGKTRALVDLACGLDPKRYRAEVGCFDIEKSPLADQLRAASIPVHEVPCRQGLNFKVVWRLARLMRQVRPEIVHCYNPRTMLYGGLAAKLLGIRGTVGSLSAFACQIPDRSYSFLPQALFTTSWRNRMRNRFVARLMRYLVVVSPTLGERFGTYNGLSPAKLRVIPYGVNHETSKRPPDEEVARFRRQLGVQPGEVIIGTSGRLVEQKDYPTVLRALALARQRVPRLRLVLAGEGPLRQPLEQLTAELGLQGHVVFLGHCDQVGLVIHSLDIFVLASIFEPFGVVLLEAKAAGQAIVATNVNEVPEIVKDGQSGLLVPPRSPEQMAETLVRLANDPELRQRLGKEALRESQQGLSTQQVATEYQNLYDIVRGISGSSGGTSMRAIGPG
jgi:glycosyltransferase involved in cell wall biosynthesis